MVCSMDTMSRMFLIYTRVSTAGQDDNTSQSRQVDQCRAYGESQGWTFLEHIHDTQTGKSYSERQGVRAVLDRLESGRATDVVCYSVDRTGREVSVIQQFFKDIYLNGARVSIVTKSRTYKSFLEIRKDTVFDAAVADYERTNIVDRLTDGKMYAFTELKSAIFAPPYGYNIKSGKVEHARQKLKVNYFEVNTDEADRVNELLEQYVKTGSIMQTVQYANKHGFKSKRGGVFGAEQLKDMLNRVDMYAGRPREETLKGVTRTMSYEAITTEELADKVKSIMLTTPRKVRGKDTQIPPFYQLITCSCCGEIGIGNGGWREGKHGVYGFQCASLKRQRNLTHFIGKDVSNPTKCTSQIALNNFIRAVKSYLDNVSVDTLETQFEYEVSKQLVAVKSLYRERAVLVSNKAELKTKQGKLVNAVTKLAGESDFAIAMGAINEQLKDVQAELTDIDVKIKGIESALELKDRVFHALGINLANLDSYTTPNTVTKLSVSDISKLSNMEQFTPIYSDAIKLHDSFIKEHAEQIRRKLSRLSTLVDGNNYEEFNLIMRSLGLRLTADFSDKQQKTRTASIRVLVDFESVETLLAVSPDYRPSNVSKTGTY